MLPNASILLGSIENALFCRTLSFGLARFLYVSSAKKRQKKENLSQFGCDFCHVLAKMFPHSMLQSDWVLHRLNWESLFCHVLIILWVRIFFDALICDADFGQNPRKVVAYVKETIVTNFFSAHVQCTFAKIAEKFLMKKQQKVNIWNLAQKKVVFGRSCCESQTQSWQSWPKNVVEDPRTCSLYS